MNIQRRASRKAILRLENLEDRITPVAIDPASAHAAGLLAHTNVIIKAETGEHRSHQADKAALELHQHRVSSEKRLHDKALHQTGAVAANPVPVTIIAVSYQPTVTSPTTSNIGDGSNVGTDGASTGATTTTTNHSTGTGDSNVSVQLPVNSNQPANLATALQDLYQEFQATGGPASFETMLIEGSSVGVEIKGNGGNFDTLVADMEKLGLVVNAEDSSIQMVAGLLPIDNLLKVAEDSLTLSITPEFLPKY